MKESSKNEQSSIEEDVKILESIIKINNDYLKGVENQTINQKEIKALEHILSDYKRVLKENEELKEKENKIYKGYAYIPAQKIKDIIDRIDYDIKKTKEIISNDPKNNYQITRLKAMNTKSLDIKKRLQELLESEE